VIAIIFKMVSLQLPGETEGSRKNIIRYVLVFGLYIIKYNENNL